ncbi:ATP-dependent DNA helicase DinG [Litorilituus lipolyticus]|uniref:ATP-dependent DNA helicase DinG n=1 Tax=Litorilituus lipolyticus TaxID=2491017 RepID=A0A502KW01_9GAMM|nr:ATP-dependent DNA helicase DinG [Litorilituus lipolyticus]TPH15838.1 ATP-dependent DNA helicase DinG [Litorilituus lipolyticus]
MLTDKLKQTIRQAHKAIGENLPNYMPRKQQNLLVAEIAKTLAGEYSKDRKIITIEAGTGTGKSLAYCLSTIPLALAQSRKVCISTATVALQEQLVNKDLPFLKRHAGLNFDFVLAKGRQRYVCRQKLAQAVSTDSPQAGFTFAEKPKASDIRTLNAMHKALLDGSWQGDIDSWESALPHHIWHQVQSDKHSCLKHLSEHSHCPFHKARETMEQANVLVVNHGLLLADLELGGGRILSTPEDTYYVIDEAHHLPKVTRDHSSANITLKGAIDWLKKVTEVGDKMAKLIKSQKAISPALKLADDCQDLLIEMQKVLTFVENNSASYFPARHEEGQINFKKDDEQVYRFENGIIPKTLKNWSHDIKELSKKSLNSLNKLYNSLIEAVKDGDTQMYLAEPLLAEAGFLIQRLENLEALWAMYAKTDSENGAPMARWLENLSANDKRKRQDYMMCASPIDVGFALEDMLWSQCAGAVLCSATLMALNSFDHFRYQAGLRNDDGSQYQHVNSPFDYQNNAELIIAKMDNEPNSPDFTDELIKKIPTLLKKSNKHRSSLVLFSSYWQMEKVAKSLRDEHQLTLLVQGEDSRQYIIDKHKSNCDKDKDSIIFGTQSFSEGLDLPGKYLTNLIITKLPFSVPTSPVEQAQAEHVTAKGGNPFMTLSVPDTSKKLVQACGRLLRNEKDSGQIVLLDKRAVTKRYGKQLLDSLPPFKRIVE